MLDTDIPIKKIQSYLINYFVKDVAIPADIKSYIDENLLLNCKKEFLLKNSKLINRVNYINEISKFKEAKNDFNFENWNNILGEAKETTKLLERYLPNLEGEAHKEFKSILTKLLEDNHYTEDKQVQQNIVEPLLNYFMNNSDPPQFMVENQKPLDNFKQSFQELYKTEINLYNFNNLKYKETANAEEIKGLISQHIKLLSSDNAEERINSCIWLSVNGLGDDVIDYQMLINSFEPEYFSTVLEDYLQQKYPALFGEQLPANYYRKIYNGVENLKAGLSKIKAKENANPYERLRAAKVNIEIQGQQEQQQQLQRETKVIPETRTLDPLDRNTPDEKIHGKTLFVINLFLRQLSKFLIKTKSSLQQWGFKLIIYQVILA